MKNVYKNKGLILTNRRQGVAVVTILGDDWRQFGDDSPSPLQPSGWIERDQ
jgi:hypothetical protein